MKKIKLTQGKYAIVDDEDFDRLNQYKWYYDNKYAKRTICESKKRYALYIHRKILNLSSNDKIQVDHINHNKLDNRKENLRLATRGQNSQNRTKLSNNTSGYKGVSWHKYRNKWRSIIIYNKQYIYLGLFSNKKDAVTAYKHAAIKYHGEFACVD